jgi:hypothetical protein
VTISPARNIPTIPVVLAILGDIARTLKESISPQSHMTREVVTVYVFNVMRNTTSSRRTVHYPLLRIASYGVMIENIDD